ncbi:uncharacterized protein LOC144546066 [Carex rostrata]
MLPFAPLDLSPTCDVNPRPKPDLPWHPFSRSLFSSINKRKSRAVVPLPIKQIALFSLRSEKLLSSIRRKRCQREGLLKLLAHLSSFCKSLIVLAPFISESKDMNRSKKKVKQKNQLVQRILVSITFILWVSIQWPMWGPLLGM